MYNKNSSRPDTVLILIVFFLITVSLVVLSSIASTLFPLYFLYIILGIGAFALFYKIGFDVLSYFYKHLYIFSVFFLILPLIIGQVTRGTVRWIPIGALTIQPAEIVRPLLLVFFAVYLTRKELTAERLLKAFGFLLLPTFLILIQPSLGVSVLTVIAFLGILFSIGLPKKYYAIGAVLLLLFLPTSWLIMKDYQRDRIVAFLDPTKDPLGAGYNSLQSMVSVGSGGLFGRGLGKGVQTQLAFLPEKHTDFIFAAVAEEMGFLGALVILALTAVLLFRLINIMENAQGLAARSFMAGFFLTLLAQVFVHVGMNLGLLPITGIPYPLLSAGGSSLLATMASLGIAVSARKRVAS